MAVGKASEAWPPHIKNTLENKDDQYHGDAYTGRGPQVRAVVGLQEVISAAHWRFRVHERRKETKSKSGAKSKRGSIHLVPNARAAARRAGRGGHR